MTDNRIGLVVDTCVTTATSMAEAQAAQARLVEQVFGWLKTIGPLRKTKLRGVARVGWMFAFSAAVYNLLRISNLVAGVC